MNEPTLDLNKNGELTELVRQIAEVIAQAGGGELMKEPALDLNERRKRLRTALANVDTGDTTERQKS